MPAGRCDEVFNAYSIPNTPIDRYSYECDHRVPLAIGGANSADNLWPQPNPEAAVKDACEVEVQDASAMAR